MDKNKDYNYLFKDRRKKVSKYNRFANLVSSVNILIGISMFFLVDSWMPEGETFFDRLHNVVREDIWEFNNIGLFIFLLSFMFFSSSVALLLNILHLKRDGDKINILLIIEFILSWVVIIVYFSL